MKEHLPCLDELIRQFQRVPYLASKNVYRVAQYFLELPEAKRAQFVAVLEDACNQTVHCVSCYAWKERKRPCAWCDSPRRNKQLICVVETWHDLCALERAGSYNGMYHILGGTICPLEGIGPEELTIKNLILRLQTGQYIELIFALNQTVEGEATAAFIMRALGALREKLSITCLSRGVPVGSSLDMMDRLTVGKAIAERRPF